LTGRSSFFLPNSVLSLVAAVSSYVQCAKLSEPCPNYQKRTLTTARCAKKTTLSNDISFDLTDIQLRHHNLLSY